MGLENCDQNSVFDATTNNSNPIKKIAIELGNANSDRLKEIDSKNNVTLQSNGFQYEILKSISEIFDYINLLDFDNMVAKRFDQENNIIDHLDLINDPHTTINKQTVKGVIEGDKERFWRFTDLSTLEERMRGKKDITSNFKYEGDYWFRAQYIRIGADTNSPLSLIAYGIKDITQDKKSELEARQESMRLFNTLKSMATIYYSMHVVDLVENTVIEIDAKNEVKSLSEKISGADNMMRFVISGVTTDEYREAALEFTDLSTLPERMKGKRIISREFIGKRIGWFVASFISIDIDDKGRPIKIIFTTQSIDEEKKKEESLILKSNTDELTGFYNRRAYEEMISRLETKGVKNDFVYISIDVNGLKDVNDNIGHIAGDELLVGACDCMRRCIGPYGNLYRTGGDEFIALISASEQQLRSILMAFDERVDAWKGTLIDSLSLSYGVVRRSEMLESSMHDIAVLADKRMYEAKERYYSTLGIDRRGQKEAYSALCSLYTKIMKINLTTDEFQILNIAPEEAADELPSTNKFSERLEIFYKLNKIHPDDLAFFTRKINMDYMRDYFKRNKNSLNVLYKRLYGNEYRNTILKMIPSSDYEDDNQKVFLYVERIDK